MSDNVHMIEGLFDSHKPEVFVVIPPTRKFEMTEEDATELEN